MESYEFNHGMTRVKACFPVGLNEEKIKIIFEKVEHLSGEEFSWLVNKIITTFKHAPTVSDFIELGSSASRLRVSRQEQKEADQFATCGKCHNGIVMAVKKETLEYYFAFKCPCPIGRNRLENWPEWNQSYIFRFKLKGPAERDAYLKIMEPDPGPSAS